MTLATIASGTANAFSQPIRVAPDAGPTGEGLCVLAPRLSADWFQECAERIDRLRDLPVNWNSYGALAVDARSIEIAKVVIERLARLTGVGAPHIAASPSGHVALMWEWNSLTRELDIEIVPDGTLRFAYLDERNPDADEEGETTDLAPIALLLTNW